MLSTFRVCWSAPRLNVPPSLTWTTRASGHLGGQPAPRSLHLLGNHTTRGQSYQLVSPFKCLPCHPLFWKSLPLHWAGSMLCEETQPKKSFCKHEGNPLIFILNLRPTGGRKVPSRIWNVFSKRLSSASPAADGQLYLLAYASP